MELPRGELKEIEYLSSSGIGHRGRIISTHYDLTGIPILAVSPDAVVDGDLVAPEIESWPKYKYYKSWGVLPTGTDLYTTGEGTTLGVGETAAGAATPDLVTDAMGFDPVEGYGMPSGAGITSRTEQSVRDYIIDRMLEQLKIIIEQGNLDTHNGAENEMLYAVIRYVLDFKNSSVNSYESYCKAIDFTMGGTEGTTNWYHDRTESAIAYARDVCDETDDDGYGLWKDFRSLQSSYSVTSTFGKAIRKFAQWGYYVRANPGGPNWNVAAALKSRISAMPDSEIIYYLPTGGPESRNGINMFTAGTDWSWHIDCTVDPGVSHVQVYHIRFFKNKAQVRAADYHYYPD